MIIKRSKLYCTLVALALSLFFIPITQVNAQETRVIEVEEITGIAYVQYAGSQKTFRAAVGMQLQQGDRLQTDELSNVVLKIKDTKDIITIGEKADISIVHLQDVAGSKHTEIKVWKGSVYADVTPLTNSLNTFLIETNGVLYNAKGTHFVVSVDPVTGTPRVVVGAGVVSTSMNNNSSFTGIGNVYPGQESYPSLIPGNNSTPISPDDLVGSADPSIIESLLRNKRQIDEENRNILDAESPDDLDGFDFLSNDDLQRYKQNVDNALLNILKSALESGSMTEDKVQEILETINSESEIPGNVDLDRIPPILTSPSEQLRQQQREQAEERKRQQVQQKEEKRQEVVNNNASLIQQIIEQQKRLEQANREAQEKKQQEATDRLLESLTESQRQALEQRMNEKEQQRNEQEQARNQRPTPTPPAPPSNSGGGGRDDDDDDPPREDPNAEKVKIVVEAIEAIPTTEEITLADYEQFLYARSLYNDLDETLQLRVTNLNHLVAAEEAVNALLDSTYGQVFLSIYNLPTEITLEDINEVMNVRASFEELDEEAKNSVSNIEKLQLAEEQVAHLLPIIYAQDNLNELSRLYDGCENLSEGESCITDDYEYLILETKAFVNSLSAEQKSKLSEESIQLLNIIEIDLITNKINDLPSTPDSITFENIETINYVKESYDNFEAEQELSPDVQEKLNSLVARRDELILEEFYSYIEYLDSLNEISSASKNHLYKLYNMILDSEQKEHLKNILENNNSESSTFIEIPSDLNFVNVYSFDYISDGNNAIYIPLYTKFDSKEHFEEYIKGYVGSDFTVNIEFNDGSIQLNIVAEFPKDLIHWNIQGLWYEDQYFNVG